MTMAINMACPGQNPDWRYCGDHEAFLALQQDYEAALQLVS